MKIKPVVWASAAFLVLIGLFNMLCFVFIDTYSTSFYISIGFGNGAIIAYALSTLLMSKKGRYVYLSVQDGFIIGGYTVVCIILNLIFIFCRMDSIKANIITNVLVLGVYLIVLFVVFANTATITEQLEHDRRERNVFYELKDKAQALLGRGENRQINKKIESLYDKISSGQINGTTMVYDMGSKIWASLNDLAKSLSDGDSQEVVISKIDELMMLVDNRNRQITNELKR